MKITRNTTIIAAAAVFGAAVFLTGCAPATSEERAIQVVEEYIATADSDQPSGVCEDANLTSGISTEATIYAIEPLGESADGEVFEVDLIPEGYVQELVTESMVCTTSAVPWSG